MDKEIVRALESDRLIDITTVGRKTGNHHRIEIAFNTIDSKVYITGMPPKKRDWYANMVAHPDFTFHLKQSIQADIAARAAPILDEVSRREILTVILKRWKREADLEVWLKKSPLVEVTLKNGSPAEGVEWAGAE